MQGRASTINSIFREFDTDASGHIDMAEFQQAMARIAAPLSDAELVEVFEHIDSQGLSDGKIVYKELALALAKFSRTGACSPQQQLMNAAVRYSDPHGREQLRYSITKQSPTAKEVKKPAAAPKPAALEPESPTKYLQRRTGTGGGHSEGTPGGKLVEGHGSKQAARAHDQSFSCTTHKGSGGGWQASNSPFKQCRDQWDSDFEETAHQLVLSRARFTEDNLA